MARSTETTTVRDLVITIRAARQQRDLIDRAARASNQIRSQFMLESACREAQEVILEQTVFRFDAEAFARFTAMLDNPREPSDELRRLLRGAPPWE